MSFNFASGAGGAATGAELGSIIPGVGTAVGGVLGFLGGGLFGGNRDVATYEDPYKSRLDDIISQLDSSKLGKEFTASATGNIRRQALDNLRTISNSGVGRNAAVLSRLTDKTQTGADYDITKAQLQGAEFDQQSKLKAAGLMESQRNFDYNDFLRRNNESRTPTPGEELGYEVLGGVAGAGVGNLLNPTQKPSAGYGKYIADTTVANSGIPLPLPNIGLPQTPDFQNLQYP